MREDQYDYIINKPELNEDTLAHFGIKGMKWRKHLRKLSNKLPGAAGRRKNKYNAQKIADDIESGRANTAYGKSAVKGYLFDKYHHPTLISNMWEHVDYNVKDIDSNKKYAAETNWKNGDVRVAKVKDVNKAIESRRKRKK